MAEGWPRALEGTLNAILPRLRDLEDPSFDIMAANRALLGSTEDPYPLIHQKAAEGAVHAGSFRSLFDSAPDVFDAQGFKQYTVFGYDNVVKVLVDQETYTNHEVLQHFVGRTFGASVTQMDPPEHTKYRKIFQKAFLPQTVGKWGAKYVDPVVNRLMDGFIHRGKAELIHEFTHLYPFQVIYTQLGLDEEQGPLIRKLADAQLLNMIGMPQGVEAGEKLGEFFEALIAIRRANPGEDLVSHLATVEADGERLPDDVLLGFLRQLMNAGGDTTYRGTSNLLTGLLNNPDQLEAVRQDRSLVSKAIDEALRWEAPILRGWRYSEKDVEIEGFRIPKGSVVIPVLASANRDPSKFEDPDRFNIFREHRYRPIPFSTGPHVCIGQHLAKLEMSRALNAILDRLTNLRLDPDFPAPQPLGNGGRVAEHIYVEFDPS